MKEDVAIEALRQVKKVFDKHAIEFWLDMGTLLGAVRDKKFISWDSDIDLGVWGNELPKIARACIELQSQGFKAHFTQEEIGLCLKEKRKEGFINVTIYRIDDGMATMVFFVNTKQYHRLHSNVKKRKDLGLLALAIRYLMWLFSAPVYFGDSPRFVPEIFHITLIKICRILPYWLRLQLTKIVRVISNKMGFENIQLAIPQDYFTNLSTINFYGMEFKVPAKAEEYLAYRYGKDWKIPKKDYIYYEEDGAICHNR